MFGNGYITLPWGKLIQREYEYLKGHEHSLFTSWKKRLYWHEGDDFTEFVQLNHYKCNITCSYNKLTSCEHKSWSLWLNHTTTMRDLHMPQSENATQKVSHLMLIIGLLPPILWAQGLGCRHLVPAVVAVSVLSGWDGLRMRPYLLLIERQGCISPFSTFYLLICLETRRGDTFLEV